MSIEPIPNSHIYPFTRVTLARQLWSVASDRNNAVIEHPNGRALFSGLDTPQALSIWGLGLGDERLLFCAVSHVSDLVTANLAGGESVFCLRLL